MISLTLRAIQSTTVVVLSTCCTLLAQDTDVARFTRWQYESERDIGYFALTPLGSILVTTSDGAAVLDPETGKTLWTSSNLRDCQAAETPDDPPKCQFGNLGKGTLTIGPASDAAIFEYE